MIIYLPNPRYSEKIVVEAMIISILIHEISNVSQLDMHTIIPIILLVERAVISNVFQHFLLWPVVILFTPSLIMLGLTASVVAVGGSLGL